MEDGNCLSHKDSGRNYDLFGRFSFVITPEQKVTPHCMLWLVFLLPDGTSNRLWLNLTPPQSLNTTKVTGQNLQVLLDGLYGIICQMTEYTQTLRLYCFCFTVNKMVLV